MVYVKNLLSQIIGITLIFKGFVITRLWRWGGGCPLNFINNVLSIVL